jgi:predicted transposase YdaD
MRKVWHFVVLLPALVWDSISTRSNRATEQANLHPHRSLLSGDQVHRVYLDELGDARRLPVPIAATVLTIVEESEAPAVARDILERAQREDYSDSQRRDIIDIVMYKFANLSQTEVKEMLGLNLTEDPRAIREAKEEGALAIVTRQLSRRLGEEIPEETAQQLTQLPLASVTELSEALFEFSSLGDLQTWLSGHPPD